MAFPFSVIFNNKLETTVKPSNQQEILQYIVKCLLIEEADNIVVQDLNINYKGSTSYSRGSRFRGVDDGNLKLIYKDKFWWLFYQINMQKLFITTAIMSGCMEIVVLINDGPWWIGILCFLWLCGMNWISNIIKHGNVASDIATGIDELKCCKSPSDLNKAD